MAVGRRPQEVSGLTYLKAYQEKIVFAIYYQDFSDLTLYQNLDNIYLPAIVEEEKPSGALQTALRAWLIDIEAG